MYFRNILLLSFILPLSALAEGKKSIDIDVHADLHSSLQLQWKRIEFNNTLYQKAKTKLRLDDSFSVLPYGIYVELQTNDKYRTIFLNTGNLISTNKIDTIERNSIYISLDGGKPVSAKEKLSMLQPADRGMIKKQVVLFIIKKQPYHKPGQYLATFQFVNNSMP